MEAGSGCFCASYLTQKGNWWPLEFVFHGVGQSSPRSYSVQSAGNTGQGLTGKSDVEVMVQSNSESTEWLP